MKPLTIKDFNLSSDLLDLPLHEGQGECNDIGWAVNDLMTIFNTLIEKYERTNDHRYFCILGRIFYTLEKHCVEILEK